MSKFTTLELWNEQFGNKEQVYDYAGRLMLKSACGDPNSRYHPTIDHVRPISNGGKDVKENIVICHRKTNEEKGDSMPHFMANGIKYKIVRKKGTSLGYEIKKDAPTANGRK